MNGGELSECGENYVGSEVDENINSKIKVSSRNFCFSSKD